MVLVDAVVVVVDIVFAAAVLLSKRLLKPDPVLFVVEFLVVALVVRFS